MLCCADSIRGGARSDTVELLQLHHFYDKLEPWRPQTVEETVTLPKGMGLEDLPSIEVQMGALKELQDEGKIKYIGMNNATSAQLQQAWDAGLANGATQPFHTLQVRYHLFSRTMVETDVVPWCREHGVGILAHSVLGKGLCTGKHPANKVWPEDDERGTDAYNQDFMGERWSGPSQTGQLD